MQEFQEATARFDHVENPDAHWVALDPRQVQTLDQPPDIDRLALPLGWFRKHRIPLNAATLILATDDAMTPAIPKGATAIIHTGETDLGKDASVYAVNISGVIKLRRVELGEDYIIARPDNPTTFTDTIPKRYAGTITILGRLRAVVSSLD